MAVLAIHCLISNHVIISSLEWGEITKEFFFQIHVIFIRVHYACRCSFHLFVHLWNQLQFSWSYFFWEDNLVCHSLADVEHLLFHFKWLDVAVVQYNKSWWFRIIWCIINAHLDVWNHGINMTEINPYTTSKELILSSRTGRLTFNIYYTRNKVSYTSIWNKT